MKYLYLIIRHMFPRKIWTKVEEIQVIDEDGDNIYKKRIYKDQFGNVKMTKF
jgi:uncharacterized protein YnzC (UPF0291/DUF896 family)